MTRRIGQGLCAIAILACFARFAVAQMQRAQNEATPREPAAPAVEALAPFRDLVGEWRGVGQPQRGSTRGAWVEKGQWAWHFEGRQAELRFTSPEAKYVPQAQLVSTEQSGDFELRVTPPVGDQPAGESAVQTTTDARTVIYRGQRDEQGKLAVTADEPPAGMPSRITLGLVANGDRMVMLLERKAPAGERFSRMAEIGFTRQGSQFGKGNTQPECIVTGGHGSIAVEHEGKTYYVCCSGCRDLFNDAPAQALADYRERKAAEKADQNDGGKNAPE